MTRDQYTRSKGNPRNSRNRRGKPSGWKKIGVTSALAAFALALAGLMIGVQADLASMLTPTPTTAELPAVAAPPAPPIAVIAPPSIQEDDTIETTADTSVSVLRRVEQRLEELGVECRGNCFPDS